jgi:tetratricopeptide (TPR) repeat protein
VYCWKRQRRIDCWYDDRFVLNTHSDVSGFLFPVSLTGMICLHLEKPMGLSTVFRRASNVLSMPHLSKQRLRFLLQGARQDSNYHLAEQLCRELKTRLLPDDSMIFWLLAQIHSKQGNHNRNIYYLKICVSLNPNISEFRFALVRSFRATGNIESAISQLDWLIQNEQRSTAAKIEKADLLEYASRYAESAAMVADMVSAEINDPQLTLVRSKLALHSGKFEEVIRINKSVQQMELLNLSQRATQLFLTGQAYDRLGDPVRAMEVVGLANQLHHVPFDRDAFREDIDRTLAFFTKEQVEKCRQRNMSNIPIFIATMPRSGSTLLEQMIQSHGNVAGAGEVAYFYALRMKLMQANRFNYPSAIARMTDEELARLASSYLDRVLSMREDKPLRMTDKSIENYREFGLISMLFPNARLIHLKRNALDCCLSMYMNRFDGGLLPMTCSLNNIGFFYKQHNRCMRHWKDNVGLSILEVSYENLVVNPEDELRRIFEFCDLPWDEACLNFYISNEPAKTISYHQVSKPLYSSSIGISEKYRPYIGELIASLNYTD